MGDWLISLVSSAMGYQITIPKIHNFSKMFPLCPSVKIIGTHAIFKIKGLS
jgi:hypothetical protein